MTEKSPATLDRLWDDIPTGHAPIADLLSAGQAVKRRQRRVIAVGVAAATALILGIGALGTQALDGKDDRPGPVADGTTDGSGSSTRLVGIGHVAVAVPASWEDDAASCNKPFKNTVFFPWPQDCVAVGEWAVSSVAITTGEFTETGHLDDLKPADSLDGHQVVENTPNCLQGYSANGQVGSSHCTQTFGIPDLRAYFTASVIGDDAEHRLNTIRQSLTVLPEDRVAVPFVPEVTSGTAPDDVRAALEKAGLSADVVEWTCPATADCAGDGVTDVEPTYGSVVSVGSTVTVKVLDNEAPTDNQRTPCGPNDLCSLEKTPPDTVTPDCPDGARVQATLDIFDDTAAATPERAVAPMLAADEQASAPHDVDAGAVRIALLRADGTTRAVVTVERVHAGWRPSTINGCPGEMPRRRQR